MRTHGRTHGRTHERDAPADAQMYARCPAASSQRARVLDVCDDELFNGLYGESRRPPAAELLTLALLEDVAAVLHQHGFPPLRGYALAELTASLYRLQPPQD
jgi:hypothetical protein